MLKINGKPQSNRMSSCLSYKAIWYLQVIYYFLKCRYLSKMLKYALQISEMLKYAFTVFRMLEIFFFFENTKKSLFLFSEMLYVVICFYFLSIGWNTPFRFWLIKTVFIIFCIHNMLMINYWTYNPVIAHIFTPVYIE